MFYVCERFYPKQVLVHLVVLQRHCERSDKTTNEFPWLAD